MSAWSVGSLRVGKFDLEVAETEGGATPVLYLHGLGSDRRDFQVAAGHPVLSSHRLLVPDLPGHGGSGWAGGPEVAGAVDAIDSVVEAAEALLAARGIREVHLIGHSLGGAIAVRLAARLGEAVRGLVSIEGNLVEEDCGVLSRRTLEWGKSPPDDAFFDMLDRHLAGVGLPGYAEFLAGYRGKIRSRQAWYEYARALKAHTRRHRLLEAFLGLRCRRAYVHGAVVNPPPLAALRREGIPTLAIPESTHWPMYSNAPGLLDVLGRLVTEFEKA